MRDLPISYGNSCRARFWSNKMTTWEEICERLGNTIRTTETVEEYGRMRKSDREAAKDRGDFVAGHTRYRALRKLGYEECDVIVANSLTEEQKKKYRLYDNKTAEFAHGIRRSLRRNSPTLTSWVMTSVSRNRLKVVRKEGKSV